MARVDEYTEYFTYLDALRESAITDMFAASPFIEARFDLPDNDARSILVAWMNTFDPAIMPELRAKNYIEGNKNDISTAPINREE